MGPVGLFALAFLAKPYVAGRGLDRERSIWHGIGGGELAITILGAKRRSGVGEDGYTVAPVEEKVEENDEKR